MKKFFLVFSALALTLVSCKKEIKPTATSNGKEDSGYTKNAGRSASCNNEIAVENGMLKFDNFDHFLETYECLVGEYVYHTTAYFEAAGYADYDSLDEDYIEGLTAMDEFDPFFPLRDFESSFSGFVSLREYHEQDELEWMEENDLNPALDPYKDFTLPRIMYSMFDRYGRVMIEDSIYTDDLVKGASRAYNDCWQWRSSEALQSVNSSKRYRAKTGIHYWGLSTTFFSETIAYRKVGSKWKYWFTKVGTRPRGYYHNPVCDEEPNMSFSANWRILPWGFFVSKLYSVSHKGQAREGVSEYVSDHLCKGHSITRSF